MTLRKKIVGLRVLGLLFALFVCVGSLQVVLLSPTVLEVALETNWNL